MNGLLIDELDRLPRIEIRTGVSYCPKKKEHRWGFEVEIHTIEKRAPLNTVIRTAENSDRVVNEVIATKFALDTVKDLIENETRIEIYNSSIDLDYLWDEGYEERDTNESTDELIEDIMRFLHNIEHSFGRTTISFQNEFITRLCEE